MEIHRLKVTGTDDERTHTVQIKGELIATHRRDHNHRNKSQSLDRVVTTYAVYQRADDFYLLHEQKTIVGCFPVQKVREFPTLHLMDLAEIIARF